MSLNNNYIYPIMVSITSILLNSENNTYIHFNLLLSNDVEKINLNKIISLKKLKSNIHFRFYKVGNKFNGWKHGRNIPVPSFYRSILGEIIYNTNKIIYLDGDTLIYKDLTSMYNINMDYLYFRGIREVPASYEKNIDKSSYICAGVMLINIELLRKEKVFHKFKNYYYTYYDQGIYYGDQHIINDLFRNKIGYLPPKYGIFFINKQKLNLYKNLEPLIYTEKELLESVYKPVIRHINGITMDNKRVRKPWKIDYYTKIKSEWNYYANKTGYYSSICSFYKKVCLNINPKKI